MKILILLYTIILLIISQEGPARFALFIAMPLLVILIIRHLTVNSFGLKKVLFLACIVLLGFLSSLAHLHEYNLYYVTRDVMYFTQALIFIVLGIFLYEENKDFRKLLKIIVLSSFAITLYKLTYIIADPTILLLSFFDIRYEYNLSNETALITLIILFYSRKIKYKLFTSMIEFSIMALSILSIAVSFSRTIYVLVLITLIIPYITKTRILLKGYVMFTMLILFIIFGGLFVNNEAGGIQGSNFQSKMMHSLDEMTVRDYDNMVEINHNWRGFEAYLGLQKYYTGNPLELLIGQGYGSVVYTPNWIFKDAETNLDVLPMFHNGYITIILKTGLFGLFLFFFWLYVLLKTGTSVSKTANNPQQGLEGSFLQASVFIILFQTIVTHGIFKTTVPVLLLILIGMSLHSYGVRMNTKNNSINIKIREAE